MFDFQNIDICKIHAESNESSDNDNDKDNERKNDSDNKENDKQNKIEKKEGFLTRKDIMRWLMYAKSNIVDRHKQYTQKQTDLKPFDAIIFYITSHGTTNES